MSHQPDLWDTGDSWGDTRFLRRNPALPTTNAIWAALNIAAPSQMQRFMADNEPMLRSIIDRMLAAKAAQAAHAPKAAQAPKDAAAGDQDLALQLFAAADAYQAFLDRTGQFQAGASARTITNTRSLAVRLQAKLGTRGDRDAAAHALETIDAAMAEPRGAAVVDVSGVKLPPTQEEIDDAIAWVQEAASLLASKPPPGPRELKDDTGLSGSTNAPIRSYIGATAADPHAAPPALHFGAVEYLRAHSRTQLDRAGWERAHDVLSRATSVPPELARQLTVSTSRWDNSGAVTRDGSFTLDRGKAVLNVNTSKQHNISGAKLAAAGFVKGKDYNWKIQGYGRNKTFLIVVEPHAIEKFSTFLEDSGWSDLATALRVGAYQAKDELEAAAQAQAQEAASAADFREKEVAALTKTLNPREGVIYGISWKWSPRKPLSAVIETPGNTGAAFSWVYFVFRDEGIQGLRGSRGNRFVLSTEGDPSDITKFALGIGKNRRVRDPYNDEFGKHAQLVVSTFLALSDVWGAVADGFVGEDGGEPDPCKDTVAMSRAASFDDIADPQLRGKAEAAYRLARFAHPLGLQPYPYQQVGIAFAVLNNYRAFIADDMGLGKTLQAIGTLLTDVPRLTPAVVVCPAGVVGNWADEIRLWTGGQLQPVIYSNFKLSAGMRKRLAAYAPGRHRYNGDRTDKALQSRGLLDDRGQLTPWGENPGSPFPPPLPGTVLIINWSVLAKLTPALLADFQPKTVIYDEAHYGKNFPSRSKQGRGMVDLAAGTPNALFLTGTPYTNRPMELFNQLRALDPRYENLALWDHLEDVEPYAKSPYAQFGNRYAGGVQGRYQKYMDATFLPELNEQLRCFMVRRLKTQPAVISQLPPMTRTARWVQLPDAAQKVYDAVGLDGDWERIACTDWVERISPKVAAEYRMQRKAGADRETATRKALAWANNQRPSWEASEALTLMNALKNTVGILKVPAAVEFVTEHFDQTSNPLVVFVYQHDVRNALGEAFNHMTIEDAQTGQRRPLRWTFSDGAVPSQERHARHTAFQDGEYDVIIAGVATREGVNLQRASEMLFLERWFVPGWEEQAEGRIYRGGQSRPTTVTYLMAPGTIDEDIDDIVTTKRANFETTFGGNVVAKGTDATTELDAPSGTGSLTAEIAQRIRDKIGDTGGAPGSFFCSFTVADLQAALEATRTNSGQPRISWVDIGGRCYPRCTPRNNPGIWGW